MLCSGLVYSQETTESVTGGDDTSYDREKGKDFDSDDVSEAAATTSTTTTAAPDVIIKQINEINEDGTYTVGFEAADGTFKLETRDEDGNVEGGKK